MPGPKKDYQEVIIIPITKVMKDALMSKAGRRGMSKIVRKLITDYLIKESHGNTAS